MDKNNNFLSSGQSVSEERPWRWQFTAIFWHLLFFLLPIYAVWQGLFVRWQLWFSLILWVLLAIFFLFFVASERLTPQTQAPWRWPFQGSIQNLSANLPALLRRIAGRRSKGSRATGTIFGDYNNYGKINMGSYNSDNDDDGVTIEDYLKQHRGQDIPVVNAGFDWNWRQHSHDEGEAPFAATESRPIWERWQQYFAVHWSQAWQTSYPDVRERAVLQFLFWVNALWLPVSYWLLYSDKMQILQRGGFVSYGTPAPGSFYAFLIFANLSLPILSNQVGNKLQSGLTDTTVNLAIIGNILLELGYTLASLLIVFLFINGPLAVGVTLLLAAASLCFRLLLRHKMRDYMPLFLFRQLGYFSVSLGFLLYVYPVIVPQ